MSFLTDKVTRVNEYLDSCLRAPVLSVGLARWSGDIQSAVGVLCPCSAVIISSEADDLICCPVCERELELGGYLPNGLGPLYEGRLISNEGE